MWNDRDVVRGGHGHDATRLGETTQPRDVGLEHVDGAVLDQLAEAVARVLVLARGGEHARTLQRLAHLLVTIIVVRW